VRLTESPATQGSAQAEIDRSIASMTDRADTIAAKIEAFIRADVIPYEKDPRTGPHGPSDDLV
jgi:hypothetical protein